MTKNLKKFDFVRSNFMNGIESNSKFTFNLKFVRKIFSPFSTRLDLVRIKFGSFTVVLLTKLLSFIFKNIRKENNFQILSIKDEKRISFTKQVKVLLHLAFSQIMQSICYLYKPTSISKKSVDMSDKSKNFN